MLRDLADPDSADDSDLISVLLAYEPKIDVEALAHQSGLSADRVGRALGRLGAAGRVGFDAHESAYFHRELPYDPDALESMHPRLRDAKALVDAGAVRLDGDLATVAAVTSSTSCAPLTADIAARVPGTPSTKGPGGPANTSSPSS